MMVVVELDEGGVQAGSRRQRSSTLEEEEDGSLLEEDVGVTGLRGVGVYLDRVEDKAGSHLLPSHQEASLG